MSSLVVRFRIPSWKSENSRPRAGSIELTPQIQGPLLQSQPASAHSPTVAAGVLTVEENVRLQCMIFLNRLKIGPWAVTLSEIAQVFNISKYQLYQSPHFLDRLAWLAEKQPVWRDVAKRMALVARSAFSTCRRTINVVTPTEESLIEVVNITSQHADKTMIELRIMFPISEGPQKRVRDEETETVQGDRPIKRTKTASQLPDTMISDVKTVAEFPARQYVQQARSQANQEGHSERTLASSESDDHSRIWQSRRKSARIIKPMKNAHDAEKRSSLNLRSFRRREAIRNQDLTEVEEEVEWHTFGLKPKGGKWKWAEVEDEDPPPPPKTRGRASRKTTSQQEPTPSPSVDIPFTDLISSVPKAPFERDRDHARLLTSSEPVHPTHQQNSVENYAPAMHSDQSFDYNAKAAIDPSHPITSSSSFSGACPRKSVVNDNISDGCSTPMLESRHEPRIVTMKEFLGLSSVDLSSVYERCHLEAQILMDEVKMSMPVGIDEKPTVWQSFSKNSFEMMQILSQLPFTGDKVEETVQQNPGLLSESTLEQLREEIIRPPITSGYKLHRLHYHQVIQDFVKELAKDRKKSMTRWAREVDELQGLLRETIQLAIRSLEKARLNTSGRIAERRAERKKLMKGQNFKPDLQEEAEFIISRDDSIDFFATMLKDGFSAQIGLMLKLLKEEMTELGDNAFQEIFQEAIERHS